MPLTDIKVRNLKAAAKPYREPDGGGLYLEVRPSGAKFWRYRFELPPGKESLFTIGEYPDTSLADARTGRDKARKSVKAGINPTKAAASARQVAAHEASSTFKIVCEEWMARNRPHWGAVYASQADRIMEVDVYPSIGDTHIRALSSFDVLSILNRISARGAVTMAIRARQLISSTCRYAVSTLRADIDPTAALAGALKPKPVRHHPHLTIQQIPTLLEKMRANGGFTPTVVAMKMLMLTFVRTSELRLAPWSEFDLDGAEWHIPAERMKMRRPHIVPLSRQAVELLLQLKPFTGGRVHLFPNQREPKSCIDRTTINRALKRMGYAGQLSGHGFRSTASTALHELGFPSDHIEAQLAHVDRSVRGAYNHANYLPERRVMMQAWADKIDAMAQAVPIP